MARDYVGDLLEVDRGSARAASQTTKLRGKVTPMNRFIFIGFRFLAFLWCPAVLGPSVIGNSRISRFGGFNSRLGRCKFPFRAATGICRQELDLPGLFQGGMAVPTQNRRKFPFRREKPGTGPSPPVSQYGRQTRSASPRAACWRTPPRRATRNDRRAPPTEHAPAPPRRSRP